MYISRLRTRSAYAAKELAKIRIMLILEFFQYVAGRI